MAKLGIGSVCVVCICFLNDLSFSKLEVLTGVGYGHIYHPYRGVELDGGVTRVLRLDVFRNSNVRFVWGIYGTTSKYLKEKWNDTRKYTFNFNVLIGLRYLIIKGFSLETNVVLNPYICGRGGWDNHLFSNNNNLRRYNISLLAIGGFDINALWEIYGGLFLGFGYSWRHNFAQNRWEGTANVTEFFSVESETNANSIFRFLVGYSINFEDKNGKEGMKRNIVLDASLKSIEIGANIDYGSIWNHYRGVGANIGFTHVPYLEGIFRNTNLRFNWGIYVGMLKQLKSYWRTEDCAFDLNVFIGLRYLIIEGFSLETNVVWNPYICGEGKWKYNNLFGYHAPSLLVIGGFDMKAKWRIWKGLSLGVGYSWRRNFKKNEWNGGAGNVEAIGIDKDVNYNSTFKLLIGYSIDLEGKEEEKRVKENK